MNTGSSGSRHSIGWKITCERFKPRSRKMAERSDPAKTSAEPILLVVKRTIDAPAELVFDAWLDQDSIRNWLFATPGGEMVRVEVDPRVGGEFIVFEKRGDMVAEHYGRYLEIDRPRRIVFLFA